jgi:hypothetical protein
MKVLIDFECNQNFFMMVFPTLKLDMIKQFGFKVYPEHIAS